MLKLNIKDGDLLIFEGNYTSGYISRDDDKIYVETLENKMYNEPPEECDISELDEIGENYEIYWYADYNDIYDEPKITDEYLENVAKEIKTNLENNEILKELMKKGIVKDWNVKFENVDKGLWKKISVTFKLSDGHEIIEELWYHPYTDLNNSSYIERLKFGEDIKIINGVKYLSELKKNYNKKDLENLDIVINESVIFKFLYCSKGYNK